MLAVDDPLDAVAVHFGGGVWGVISFTLFGQGGLVYGINGESVAVSCWPIKSNGKNSRFYWFEP